MKEIIPNENFKFLKLTQFDNKSIFIVKINN